MKHLISLIVLIAINAGLFSQSSAANTSNSEINISDFSIIDVESSYTDVNIIFNVDCSMKNMAGNVPSFVIFLVDDNFNPISDKFGEPIFTETSIPIEQNYESGSVSLAFPASKLPQDTNRWSLVCMIMNMEEDYLWDVSDPIDFTAEQINNLTANKALQSAGSLLDLLFGGDSDYADDSEETEQCRYCHGSGECSECHGAGGKSWGFTCMRCDNNGKCKKCGGTGKVAVKRESLF